VRPKSKILVLKPEENQLSFSYRSVDLNHPRELQYRNKIDDSKWSPWSAIHQQNFAGLGYGKHTFSAQSRNYRWTESDLITFKFNIGTPLFQKGWFQWLLIAGLLFVLLLIVYLYVQNLKKKNKAKQAQLELENHLLGLEQKALRLQMNPHFIFNVLNGIKAMGMTDTQKMNTTINSFATLLRGILNNSRKEQISVSEEINVLKNYIEVEQLMALKPFNYTLKFNSELDPEEVLIPPMLVQPFVENAIKHGISATIEKQGKLEIIFRTDATYLSCSIIDNGKGIFESQKNKTNTSHQSVALDVTKERIESLSGIGALNISEIKENNTIKGTKIEFKIPLEQEF
jgi:sensor histidine kinase YesM